MALTEFILIASGACAAMSIMRRNAKQSADIKRNVGQIRHWLEEESATISKEMKNAKPKELPQKDVPKE